MYALVYLLIPSTLHITSIPFDLYLDNKARVWRGGSVARCQAGCFFVSSSLVLLVPESYLDSKVRVWRGGSVAGCQAGCF